MGADQSTYINPALLEELKDKDLNYWDQYIPEWRLQGNNSMMEKSITTSKFLLFTEGIFPICKTLASHIGVQPISVAFPYTGNNIATNNAIRQLLRANIPIKDVFTSDITSFPNRVHTIIPSEFEEVTAPKSRITGINVLFIIDAPPNSSNCPDALSDVKLIMDYIESRHQCLCINGNDYGYIVIAGEIGAGCNTDGMYNFLLEHSHLQLLHHKYAYKRIDSVRGSDMGHREVMLFRIVEALEENVELDDLNREDIKNVFDI